MFNVEILGVKKNIPKVNFMEYSGLFISPAKFGKTTFASMMPKAITCAFEIGYRGQVMNVRDMETWDDFITFIDLLEKHRAEIGDDIRIISIDTANKAWEKCGDYTLRRMSRLLQKRCTRPQDVPHGQFYSERDKDFALQLDRINMLGFSPFFTTHSKIKTITPKEGGESYDVYATTLDDRCANIITPMVDYILYGERTYIENEMGDKKPTRMLTTKGDVGITAGNRVFFDDSIYFDSEDEAVEKFQACFTKVIEERLRKAGITEDINSIAKKQATEKKEEVKKYIESQKQPNKDELVTQIKSKYPTATADAKASMQKYMAEIGITSFAEPDKFEAEQLEKILNILG